MTDTAKPAVFVLVDVINVREFHVCGIFLTLNEAIKQVAGSPAGSKQIEEVEAGTMFEVPRSPTPRPPFRASGIEVYPSIKDARAVYDLNGNKVA